MTLALASRRTALTPPWVRNDLWRRARAVPSLDLRFADNKSLTDAVTGASLVTFTRSSNGTYTDSAGVIQTAATDVPRFDHNPTTGESLGLLVEEQRTNVAWPSADYSGANWTKTNIQVSASTTTAPDGSTCFAYEGSSASSLLKRLRFNFITTTVGAYTFSIYLKAGTENSCAITLQDNTGVNGGVVEILLTNGTVAAAAGNFGVNTGTTVLVQALSNGFYRISLTSTFVAAVTGLQAITGWDTNGSTTTTGTIFPWGAQLEAGAGPPTSYIPTTTAAVTRNADVPTITGTAFSGWYNQTEGTLFAEWFGGPVATNKFPSIAAARQASANNSQNTIEIFQGPSLTNVSANGLVRVSNVDQMSRDSGDLTLVGTKVKAALGVRTNDFVFMANGLQVGAVDTLGTLPTVDTFNIGFNSASEQLNGRISRITYWPQALPSQLRTLTQ